MGSAAAVAARSTSLFFFFCFFLFPFSAVAGPIYKSLTPPFTASYQRYIDNSGAGAFLSSPNNTFQARIANSDHGSSSYYFVVVHVYSDEIVWSANRNRPVSQSSPLRFTGNGLTLYDDSDHPIWSAPGNSSSSSSSSLLLLLESGNLILLDSDNNTLWESFDSPTDVLLEGQKLPVGRNLVSSISDRNPSEGDYRFVLTENDAMLQWNGVDYWQLSMTSTAFREKNIPVEYLVMNFSGVYLIGGNADQVVIKAVFRDSVDVSGNSSIFQMAKLESNGLFTITRAGRSENQIFAGPDDNCRLPESCGRLGLCTSRGSCSCVPAFHSDLKGECVPADGSFALPESCNPSSSPADGAGADGIKYVNLRNDLDYFSTAFSDPIAHNVNVSSCQNLCSKNCSCRGFYHSHSSGFCYLIWNSIGSFTIKTTQSDLVGYVKTVAVKTSDDADKKSDFPVLPVVLLPTSGVIAIVLVATLFWFRRRRKTKKQKSSKSGIGKYLSSAEEEIDIISIPGLPIRFTYQELVAATGDFGTQIGSGGFGTVYKGSLADGTEVAVKKITCLGSRGRREFLTEIAVIGKIHHVNLVRLRGFCAHAGQRYLVYEYMNRGSLDRALFHGDPVMEWRERYEIALGTARGLAYLHSSCENTIIHCDVKPENILLHDKSPVKISDFGLSKLLSTEESGLFTTMRGTRGYLAPEWLTSSAISDKTDVYSYGMVLLEIIRGKKNSSPQTHSNSSASDNNNRGRANGHATSSASSRESGTRLIYFPLFALEMHEEGRYSEVVDPRLAGRVPSDEVKKLLRVALCCVHEEPNLRPSMSNVVGMLEGGVPVGEPRIRSLNFLRFYGRRFTEASVLAENGNEPGESMAMYQQHGASGNTSSSYDSLSYISSQQVSGPR
ncbi:G-type lectin S-receptor-like serine/threonine-protein kinase At5g35370 [Andrographis paniculata]|uniref:G-type lectin S-receptor-like serine/threonine-protein kinase At5g35370 n=1 Tax=Andrographis paniculata TaxID=175694 RepID=UPI0021E70723|nr:G-type lectin S-receptor-like serine/threonine-protein kinase At5g35370 [Andrographis paniculata]